MINPLIDTKAAVEAARKFTNILPQEGKAAVLDHLVSEMMPDALKALSPEARRKLIAALQDTEAPRDNSLPETPALTIEQIKKDLRAADCLYDRQKIWKQLGAGQVPNIPDTVIQEAHETGGRVIFRGSSISEQADAVRAAGHAVGFWGSAEQFHYTARVSKPEWIVVPSHIDRETLDSPKREVITSDKPAPTPEDWFSVIAYARLDGGRQPKDCENLYAFTTEDGVVVGSCDDLISVSRNDRYVHDGFSLFGAARFGRPRN
jgi:hypothetical protein